MSEDLVNFPAIAIENTATYINARLKGDVKKLIPVFSTEQEKEEYCSLYNKTVMSFR